MYGAIETSLDYKLEEYDEGGALTASKDVCIDFWFWPSDCVADVQKVTHEGKDIFLDLYPAQVEAIEEYILKSMGALYE